MDPVSLAGAILSVIFSCTKAALGAHDLLKSCRDAPKLLSAVCNDCSVISLTLSRMQLLIQEDHEYSNTRFQNPDVVERMSGALDACNTTLTELEAKVTAILGDDGDRSRLSIAWSRMRLLWSEPEIEELSNRLRYHEISLSVLLQVFQTEGIFRLEDLVSAIQDTLSRHATVLEQMAILLRRRRRIPPPDLRNLSRQSAEMAESVSDLISDATHNLEDDDRHLTDSRPYRQTTIVQDDLEGATLRDTASSSSLTWSAFIVNGSSTPIFRIYSDVLFDFITETWPAEGKIGYYQLQQYALYSAQKERLPPENWVEHQASMFLDHTFSTEPLQGLYDFYGVDHEVVSISRSHKICISDKWLGIKFEVKSYPDQSPILERQGWHQWLTALLRRDPTEWLLEQVLVIDSLPNIYRRRLPRGHIPRDALPASADLNKWQIYQPEWPLNIGPPDWLSRIQWMNFQERWKEFKEKYLFHNTFMYKILKE